jgi:hypothetical protein
LFNPFRPKTPKWAAALGDEGYVVFRKILLDSSQAKIDASHADKLGSIKAAGHIINLANLVDICSRLKPEEWSAEINRWAKIFSSGQDRPDPLYPRDKKMLKLQLYPGTYFSQIGADTTNILMREDIPGTLTTVVADWPDMVIVLQDDDPKKPWVNRKQAVFAELSDHLAHEQSHDVSFIEGGKNKEELLAVIEGPEITAATHALVLADLYPQLIGAHGALVSVPFRHMVIVKRLDVPASPETISVFSDATRHMAKQTNYFISDTVYHYENKKFIRLDA